MSYNASTVPGKTAYENAREFDDAIEALEVNCGCVDYYAHGYQKALSEVKEALDAKFEEMDYEDARNILDEVFYKLEQ